MSTTEDELEGQVREILKRTDHIFTFAAIHGMKWEGGDLVPELLSLLNTELDKARIDGRRIQSEATYDKWQNTLDEGDFTMFLYGQVEAWQYESSLKENIK